MCENGLGQDTVDPRVHIELERLNNATDEINKLELELDECRNVFRQLLCEGTAKVEGLKAKLGMCIERAKSYYEARFTASVALKQTQQAAVRFEKANSAHSAAREMVYLAEQGLGGRTLDPAWQEMLNHATQRVNEAERDREIADNEHRMACIKHEAANAKVKSLQKELKRAIAKSSFCLNFFLFCWNGILLEKDNSPYYETKAYYNYMLEQQKQKIQNYETKVASVKLTYADALRNLEQISDEIHRTRKKASGQISNSFLTPVKQISLDSSESYMEDAQELVDQLQKKQEMRDGDTIKESQSTEWTEIDLEHSSPEEEINNGQEAAKRPKLIKQITLPNPKLENEFSNLRSKMKLDTTISNWISRSSAKDEDANSSRRQSLDNILGPTGEKVKEIFSHGMMMLNINSLAERRRSDPKVGITDEKTRPKKVPSPLEKTLTYLNVEEDSSDTESISSMDMLNEEQISSLMFDKEIESVCEQILGTPITEFKNFSSASTSNTAN